MIYAIQVRNMHTAIHHLALFRRRATAEQFAVDCRLQGEFHGPDFESMDEFPEVDYRNLPATYGGEKLNILNENRAHDVYLNEPAPYPFADPPTVLTENMPASLKASDMPDAREYTIVRRCDGERFSVQRLRSTVRVNLRPYDYYMVRPHRATPEDFYIGLTVNEVKKIIRKA